MRTRLLDAISVKQNEACLEFSRMTPAIRSVSRCVSVLHPFYEGKISGYNFAYSLIKTAHGVISTLRIVNGRVITITEFSHAMLQRVIKTLTNVWKMNERCMHGITPTVVRKHFLRGHSAAIDDILSHIKAMQKPSFSC